MQLMNWTRKGIYEDVARAEELRHLIEEQFSADVLAEVDAGTHAWWIR